MPAINHPISIAPMMDYTNPYFCYLARLLSDHALLYTEMLHANAILNNHPEKILMKFINAKSPIALQVGGSDPKKLAVCARITETSGFDEINLNVGCPSERVQNGSFGACLFKEPDLVAECIAEMRANCNIDVTVKTRIGVDDHDQVDHLLQFIKTVGAAGCKKFIIHARKAWLKGLSPKENRNIPPLNYQIVYQLKQKFPQYEFVINGGINHIHDIEQHLNFTDGVMIGRAVCQRMWLLAEIEQHFYQVAMPNILEITEQYIAFFATTPSYLRHHVLKPLFSLFSTLPHAKQMRRKIQDITVICPKQVLAVLNSHHM